MKLAEKIMELRKANAMTQEELASICNVSRQSISKWEADIALPETEKILLLGNIFHVSMDVLLKDELTLGEAVSYTHLDVYKRQHQYNASSQKMLYVVSHCCSYSLKS